MTLQEIIKEIVLKAKKDIENREYLNLARTHFKIAVNFLLRNPIEYDMSESDFKGVVKVSRLEIGKHMFLPDTEIDNDTEIPVLPILTALGGWVFDENGRRAVSYNNAKLITDKDEWNAVKQDSILQNIYLHFEENRLFIHPNIPIILLKYIRQI